MTSAGLPMLLVALSCIALMLVPLALREPNSADVRRDAEWRDPPPGFLRLLRPVLSAYSGSIERSMPSGRRDVITAQLSAAGVSYVVTAAEFVMLRRLAVIIALCMCVATAVMLRLRDPVWLATLSGAAALAYFYPDLWLKESAKARGRELERDLPFLMDILVLGLRAGLTFTASLEQALMQSRAGPLKQELSRYLREIRTGTARRIALERLAERVQVPAVSNFCASVIQAESTGGALSEILGEQARQRRLERFLRAEKLANQAPVKMLFPLIALLFPVTFIIIGFPIVIQLRDAGVLHMF